MANPTFILETLNSYQRTFALKGAIDLGLFTRIAEGATTAAEIAEKLGCPEKGVRVLCDYLTVIKLLEKVEDQYGLTPESAVFLNQRSPAYIGSIAGFLVYPGHVERFQDVAAIVRKGGALGGEALEPNHPQWVEFAKSMAPMMALPAQKIAEAVTKEGQPAKVLDIAAGHGMFGIIVAKHNSKAAIWAQDWENVLAVAKENAVKMGVADRFHTIPGSAFDAPLGESYDVVLLPNFLHHFDPATNVGLLRRLRAAMKPDAVLATLEFVPNDDRVSPPIPAAFSLMMLGGTPSGDAYTFKELDAMYREAGFGSSEMRELTPLPQRLILTRV